MKHVASIILLLALAARADWLSRAQIDADLAGPFATTRPSPALAQHGPVSQGLEPILIQQANFILKQLHPWDKDRRAHLLTKGGSGEHDIRPNAHAAYGLAVLARCVPLDNSPLTPAQCRDASIALLRFLLQTHGASGATTASGKPWHNQWQSAYWAQSAGRAAWLLWDDLSPTMRWLAARMVADEADRFIDRPPDHHVEKDTKAEENAWNSTIISLAFNMFPRHPHHEKWKQAAITWQLSAFATAADTKRADVIEGKPLSEWVKFPNIYDDYTLENHERVHPDYMTASRLNGYQRLNYEWAGNPVPASVLFNLPQIYANLKKLALPDGGWLYPSGQDWQLRRNSDWLDAHALAAVCFNDPQAARLLQIAIETTKKMQARDPAGGIYAPGETVFPSSQQMLLELHADAYLLLRASGEGPAPVPEEALWQQLAGSHLFPAGKFAVLRTDRSIASFSWGSQVMGMAMPLAKDTLLAPNDRSLIGQVFTTSPKGPVRDKPVVKNVRLLAPVTPPIQGLNLPPSFLAVAGVLTRGDGIIEQPFAFLAIPDGRTVYVDSPRLTGWTRPAAANFGTLGILNDPAWPYHEPRRTLFFSLGVRIFSPKQAPADGPAELASNWFNLDNLGIILLSTSHNSLYDPHPTRAAGRLEQLFHLNHPLAPELLKPTVAIFYPRQEWMSTRAAAQQCALSSPDPMHFSIRLEDGHNVIVDLANLNIIWQ